MEQTAEEIKLAFLDDLEFYYRNLLDFPPRYPKNVVLGHLEKIAFLSGIFGKIPQPYKQKMGAICDLLGNVGNLNLTDFNRLSIEALELQLINLFYALRKDESQLVLEWIAKKKEELSQPSK